MKEDWREIAGSWFYRGMPLLVSTVLVLFSFLPLKSEIADNARPAVGLKCAYFWLVYRPDLFNLPVVFVLGMIADAASAVPFGAGLTAMLVMYLLVTNLIRYLNGRIFIVLWIGIAALLPVCLLTEWMLLSFYHERALPLSLLFFSYLTSLACYPLVGGLNALVLNRFLQDDE